VGCFVGFGGTTKGEALLGQVVLVAIVAGWQQFGWAGNVVGFMSQGKKSASGISSTQ